MKKRLSHISVLQTSKVLTLWYGGIGLIFVPFGVFLFLKGKKDDALFYLLAPIFYCVLVYPLSLAACGMYNFVAKHLGGIEFTLEDSDVESSTPRDGGNQ